MRCDLNYAGYPNDRFGMGCFCGAELFLNAIYITFINSHEKLYLFDNLATRTLLITKQSI